MKLTKSLQKKKIDIRSDKPKIQNSISKSFKGFNESWNESTLVSTRYTRANTQQRHINHRQPLSTQRFRLTTCVQNSIYPQSRKIVLAKRAQSERRIKTVFELKQESKRSFQKSLRQVKNRTSCIKKIQLSIVTTHPYSNFFQNNLKGAPSILEAGNQNNYIHKFTQKSIIDQIELKLKTMKLNNQQDSN